MPYTMLIDASRHRHPLTTASQVSYYPLKPTLSQPENADRESTSSGGRDLSLVTTPMAIKRSPWAAIQLRRNLDEVVTSSVQAALYYTVLASVHAPAIALRGLSFPVGRRDCGSNRPCHT